ncbi:MAG: gliding motility-associated C-terminal domain-containing protein [Bacteroidia bacterium]|nr:gliding motility-associated C-terminal domain-containing protein [Bacteroidia bacterium]
MIFTRKHSWKRTQLLFLSFLFLILTVISCSIDASEDQQTARDSKSVKESSLRFIKNKGQWDERILFKAKMNGGEIFFEQNRITWHFFELPPIDDHPHHYSTDPNINLKGHVVGVHFENSNINSSLAGEVKSPYYHNYYLGNDSSKWASNVPVFEKIIYEGIYPGVDLRIYGFGNSLKYDFIVEPGADPRSIRLRYEGVDDIYLEEGKLLWKTNLRDVVEDAPVSYQLKADRSIPVRSKYQLSGNTVRYKFPDGYNNKLPLVIDPTMVFSTYSGSRSDNWGFTATYDEDGNSYAGGVEVSTGNALQNGYPTTFGAYQRSNRGGDREITISKFDPQGLNLLYATYLGGNREDQPHSLIANSNGELIIFGRTNSPNFPTLNSFDDSYNDIDGFDMFIAKLSYDGLQLQASTYLGGDGDDGVNGSATDSSGPTKYNYGDDARGEVFLDNEGNILVAGPTRSTNFPFSPNSYSQTVSGGQSGIVAKFSSDLRRRIWATSISGSGVDAIYTIKVDQSNNVLFAGGTSSRNLPATGVFKTYRQGITDGYIGKLSSDGGSLLSATYLGTNAYDQVYLMDVDKDDNVYVTGQTEGAFPIVNPPIGNVYVNNGAKQFVTKLDPDLNQIMFSTTIGSPNSPTPNISPTAMLVDICENVYVTGWGGASNIQGNTGGMPLENADQSTTDSSDLYIFVLSRDAQALTYASYLGGIGTSNGQLGEHVDGGTCRFDKNGVVYHAVCAQCGSSADFPTTPSAYSPNNGYPTNCNLALFKLAFDLEGVRADFSIENMGDTIFGCVPFLASFDNRSFLGANPGTNLTYEWDFGINGASSSDFEPTYEYTEAGVFEVRLIIRDPQACNLADTAYRTLSVLPLPNVDAGEDQNLCPNELAQLNGSGGVAYTWSPASGLSDPNIPNPIFTARQPITYTLTATNESGCVATDEVEISLKEANPINVVEDKRTCVGVPVLLQAWSNTGNIVSYFWSPSTGLSDPGMGTTMASPEVTTDYMVTAIDVQGCEIKDTVRVEILPVPQTVIDGVNKTCSGGLIELSASGGDWYVWSTGDTAAVLEVPKPVGQVTYIATAFIGTCEGIPDTVVVDEKFDFPEASFIPDIRTGFAPSTINFQNTSQGAFSYEWNFGLGQQQSFEESPVFTYPFEGTYEVILIAQTEFGCADTISEMIEILSTNLLVPTAFTPNGDGINDEFYITYQGIEFLNIKVFNRWGILVYENTSPDFTWDGTFKGNAVPEGVYIWTVDAIGQNGRKYPSKGTVSIIR